MAAEQKAEIPDLVPTEKELDELRKMVHIIEEGELQSVSFIKFHPFFRKVSDFLKAKGHDVVDLTQEYFESEKTKEVIIEYHVYQNKDPKDKPKRFLFDAHCDNDNGVKVCTYIYYPMCTFPTGGNLFLNKNKSFAIDIFEPDPETIKIDPRKQKVLVLEGDIPHYMDPCIGVGRRECLVVQVHLKNQIKN